MVDWAILRVKLMEKFKAMVFFWLKLEDENIKDLDRQIQNLNYNLIRFHGYLI